MQTTLLSILVATLAALSTVMLGMGQGSMTLPWVTIVAAITSVLFTDTLGWFRLNRLVANLAMLLAAVVSLHNFFQAGSHHQLLAVANLLIYVQLALLFQEKTGRIFAQLAMFSLLQVVVAALLNDRMEFGVLLIIYAVIGLFAGSLFFVYSETNRIGVVKRRGRASGDAEAVTPPPTHSLLGGPPVIDVLETADVVGGRIVGWKFMLPIVSMVLATLVFASVFFYATPRTGGANWESGSRARNVVGFSPEISLDQMGKVLLSPVRVMRVSFSNAKTNEPYTVIGDPYFRGGTLVNYFSTHGKGQWRRNLDVDLRSGLKLPSAPNARDIVRQDILLEPTGTNTLFSLYPVYSARDTPPDVRMTARTQRLHRIGVAARHLLDEYRYTVQTTAFRFGAQTQVTPHSNKRIDDRDKSRMERENRRLRFIDCREEFPKLIALADEIVSEVAPEEDNFQRQGPRMRTSWIPRNIPIRSIPPRSNRNVKAASTQSKTSSATTAPATASTLPAR